MLRIVSIVFVVIAFAAPGLAQELPVSTIESEAVASVSALPTYVEFWLHERTQGSTLTEAVANALEFEPALREEVKTRQLVPTSMDLSGVAIPDVQTKEAHISAQLRFSLVNINNADDGPRRFAALCDNVLTLAENLQCTVQGPELGVEDTESVEAAAIAQATENAYAPARAAAQLMNANVSAVMKLTIESITWNNAPETRATQPDIQSLTCTAKVKVSYLFGAS